MSYWRLHYHLVWATKGRTALITPDREGVVHDALYTKARELRLVMHAVGGVEDHLHVVASIPPSLPVADVVKGLKGASSRRINVRGGVADLQDPFRWQQGYGALTIGARSLDVVIDYVRTQREHHGRGTILRAYERVEENNASNDHWA